MDFVKQIECIVKNIYYNKSDNPLFFKQVYDGHILGVIKHVNNLCYTFSSKNPNIEICNISAYLHDISKPKKVKGNHHLESAKIAKKILEKLNYPHIEEVYYNIVAHDKNFNKKRKTIESIILINADCLDHLHKLPALLYVAYVIKKKSFEDGKTWVRKKIKTDWDCLDESLKNIYFPIYYNIKKIIQ